MPLLGIKAISHVGVDTPAPADMARFLVDFGLAPLGVSARKTFFTGTSEQPYAYVLRTANRAGLAWIAFEVEDAAVLQTALGVPGAGALKSFDDVCIAHHALAAAGWRHRWGVGRHVLGSQVFDYWHDPDGNVVEHYADGDLLHEGQAAGLHPNTPAMLAQWAPVHPSLSKAAGS